MRGWGARPTTPPPLCWWRRWVGVRWEGNNVATKEVEDEGEVCGIGRSAPSTERTQQHDTIEPLNVGPGMKWGTKESQCKKM